MSEMRDEVLGRRMCGPALNGKKHTAAIILLLSVCFVLSGNRWLLLQELL